MRRIERDLHDGAQARIAAIGMNVGLAEKLIDTDPVAAAELRQLIERIERLEEEKKAISDDISDVYAEAKANGFDTKVLRQVVRMRKQDTSERQEQDAIRDLYLHALGMLPDLPGDED